MGTGDITVNFPRTGIFIVTEDDGGEIYTLSANTVRDILVDWEGDCDFVPMDDARIFFAAYNGEPMNLYHCPTFEALIEFAKEWLPE